MSNCKTCQHYDIRPDKAGRLVARKGTVARCVAPIPDLSQILPHSVTQGYGWQQPKPYNWMQPDNGVGCPLWLQRGLSA